MIDPSAPPSEETQAYYNRSQPPTYSTGKGKTGAIMQYGSQILPEQDVELVRRLGIRWLRAADPHNKWATLAKKCVDFVEGRHWSESDKKIMSELKRPLLTINGIAPLYRLVMGYQTSNRMDTSFRPTSDGKSSEDMAQLLSEIVKTEDERIDLKFVDSDVFSDGIVTGRGWWDFRLCFEHNEYGEYIGLDKDQFSIYVDPDCNTYNPNNSAAYIQESRWASLEEIGMLFGKIAAEEARNLFNAGTYSDSFLAFYGEQDISPARYFGQYENSKEFTWDDVYHTDFVDHQAKRIRLLDSQYAIRSIKPCFMDLETGHYTPIPDEWMLPENHHKVRTQLDLGERYGNPLTVVKKPIKRIRWTVTAGDLLLHDSWSPYDTYTQIGFFPYFRRGATRGMVEDLIDPQIERNKKRSVITDILNRNANSGWIYEENTLDPEQEENLKKYGSAPGFNLKWKRPPQSNAEAPRRIEPGGYPQGLDRLEEKASEDFYEISGINQSALGQLDRVQSGRAIEARQRQAVLALQIYTDNFSRAKRIQALKKLELIQKHYVEERLFRILGEDSTPVAKAINQRMMGEGDAFQTMNDVTTGRYLVNVDEVPISATFKQAQFEEALEIVTKLGPVGALLAQTAPHLIVDMSSLPRKDEWISALQQVMGAATQSAVQDPVAASGAMNGQETPMVAAQAAAGA